jgi:hypothetical protein
VKDNCAASLQESLTADAMAAVRRIYDMKIRGAVHQRW